MSSHLFTRLFGAAVAVIPLCPTAPAFAENPVHVLEKAVSGAGVSKHLIAFQAIADAHGGNRAAGLPGYAASVDYVAGLLRKAGYEVILQPFRFNFYREIGKPSFERVGAAPYEHPADFSTVEHSGPGDVTAQVQPVDVRLPPDSRPSTSTSGCEPSDFTSFVPGRIALLQRGGCPFRVKATNAVTAGAAAVIIFNEGRPGRTDSFNGSLEEPHSVPVVATSYGIGRELAETRATVRVATQVESESRVSHNVIVQTEHGDPDDVVVVGAHLDSVQEGAGINDNGSGAGAVLEVALAMAEHKPRRAVRFIWWGAEELGLIGSKHYVRALSPQERSKIKLYLNFDMVASPNYIYGIYDGDDSDKVGQGPGPAGSAEIERAFQKYYEKRSLPHMGTDFTGRSDYGPFIEYGIPAGGLFTGGETPKTPAQAALFGGTAGLSYDSCYHRACDDLSNINHTALDVNTDAIASVTATFAWPTAAARSTTPSAPAPRESG
ncbi:aminopeptidase Y [Sinosporangium album]|uniref:Aminopeptidase Y n=1 Tax=Sinosporangium album TaxID=504805 RepID=A0A1G8H522_9ACTN|nr:M28 family metallopeptidase [Sinosporangium album]SDI01659.1 aminopeptidase Y [Sinosporangium album]